jgi:hypothetical protein
MRSKANSLKLRLYPRTRAVVGGTRDVFGRHRPVLSTSALHKDAAPALTIGGSGQHTANAVIGKAAATVPSIAAVHGSGSVFVQRSRSKRVAGILPAA